MIVAKPVLVHIIFTAFINILAHAIQDTDRISASFNHKVYRRWNSRPLELRCPFSNPSRQLWYSSNTIFKAAFGCLDGADLNLYLPVFPDVENITYIGLNSSHQAVCTFRLTGELIEGDALLFSSRSNGNGLFEVEIFASPGASLTFNTTICKTVRGVIRNGSCSSWDALGTSFTGEQLIWMNVKQQLRSQFNCVEESARTSFPAIDALTTATQFLVQLYYPPTGVELDGVGTCELTANEGHHFCPLGAMDCIDSPYGPKCRSELQAFLVEASSKLGLNGIPNAERSEVSSENLLQSIEVLMNVHSQRQTAIESRYPMNEQASIEKSPVSAFEIVQSASALLNVFSALSGGQDSPDSAINIADEYTVQRNGLELRSCLDSAAVDSDVGR
ncbi:unnamed protein product [Taenia asiatica]|uniref:CUB domain-containing protein n=1 Tax=Taenia asiatica TaxID=60517 RepID=A0A158R7M6_TAEAS|nr:unnamed protein product [Taenia asiatica]